MRNPTRARAKLDQQLLEFFKQRGSSLFSMMIAPTPSLTQMFVHPLVAHISIILHTPEPTVNILVHATKGAYAKLIYGHHF
jgi:hypothetical protein